MRNYEDMTREELITIIEEEKNLRNKQSIELRERIKELDCLYDISEIMERTSIKEKELYQGIIDLIPRAMFYPDIACARLIIKKMEFKTYNFIETDWKMEREINVNGMRSGLIQVFYREEKPDMLEGHFLQEEKHLINVIAERLGRIIERTEVEKILNKEKEKFHAIATLSPEIITIIDINGKIIYTSPVFETYYRWLPEEVKGKDAFAFIYPDDREAFIENFKEILSSPDKILTVQYRNLRKDGTYIWLESVSKNQINNPAIAGVISITRDITDRKKIEIDSKKAAESLVESEERLRTLINSMPDIVCFKDGKGRWLEANEFDLNLFQLTGVDYKGKKDSELAEYSSFYREAFLMCEDTDEKAWMGKDYSRGIEVIPRPDGKEMAFDIIKVPTFYPDGSRKGLVVVGRDITELKKTEEALKKSEFEISVKNQIAKIFLTIDDNTMYGEVLDIVLKVMKSKYGIFGFLNEGGELVCASLTREIWEQCMVIDKTIVFPRETWKGVWGRALIEGKSACSNDSLTIPEGHVPVTGALSVPIVYHSEVIGLFTVANKTEHYNETDRLLLESIADFVSPILQARLQRDRLEAERNRLEKQLRQSQKMEAIGTLAGGIAHDFNNILGSILGYTELSLMDVQEGSLIWKNLKECIKASLRARDLVKQILAVSRKSEGQKELLQINLIVKEALKLLRATIPSTIEIIQDIDKDPAAVLADATHIHQIVMNLCTNSAHAMSGRRGSLEVSLKNIEITDKESHLYNELPQGPYVKLTIKDTGHGMTRDVIDHIFEPYFTTKKHGEGSGLGLAVVHGIVKSYRGEIRVESEPEKGSTFYIYLPRVITAIKEEIETKAPLPCGKERILIVDDEEILVNAMGKMLEKLGYTVIVKNNAYDLLGTFCKEPHNFDLVITDQTMPQMTGIELAGELTGIRPDIPVVLCSGYTDIISMEKARETGIRDILKKPVTLQDLAGALENLFRGNN
ncbi:MAG: PAS domain S-box protein [Candidatus Eremiobacterota bacterium]